ncbi:hypothetical protein BVRB_7g161490 [Beta vulgaris subsp. vulgaris]|nr:hypothetical protein BVRB_7g161490 [Beta vulgaris subsp. vulgaris]
MPIILGVFKVLQVLEAKALEEFQNFMHQIPGQKRNESVRLYIDTSGWTKQFIRIK